MECIEIPVFGDGIIGHLKYVMSEDILRQIDECVHCSAKAGSQIQPSKADT